MISRRSLITGLISLVAAPAIVRAGSLMPVKMLEPALTPQEIIELMLKRRMDECFTLMRQSLVASLYGDRVAWVDAEQPRMVRLTEPLHPLIVKGISLEMPYGR